ncbi:CrcB family protein [Microbacterium sp. NPDC019599]|uniref:fluoride efflux transporter FluC n=1 Tax=Microbacterium sp. NPDC019599 TaxID=3154690 RepID=UPI0033E99F9D
MVRRRAFTPAAFVAVVLGGALGVAGRAAITLPFQDAQDSLVVPAVTLAVNLVGSFLLGVLVGWVDDRRPLLRAFVGTGILGGFTTYSAFAVQVAETGGTAPVVSLILAAMSIFTGVLAAALGLRVGHAGAHVPASRVEPPEAAE